MTKYFVNLDDKIYIAGHRGLVGSAIVRRLKLEGFNNLLVRTHKELDLVNQSEVQDFFKKEKPDYVILAAAKVGGIHANNTYPADFIYQNIMIEANIINSSYENNVKRLLFLGSTCIYPKFAQQPMHEGALLTGALEPTNEPYALAKISGIKLCESYNRQHDTDFRSVMPTNLYGVNDNFHANNSHVVPALIQKFHRAKVDNKKEVEIWGTGRALREFLYVDDMAEASLFVLNLSKEKYRNSVHSMLSHINIGTGEETSIKDLAFMIKKEVGYTGKLVFNATRPEGPPRKLTDVSRLSGLGWKYKTTLDAGIRETCKWYLDKLESEKNN